MNEKAVEPLGFAHRKRFVKSTKVRTVNYIKNATAGAISGRVQL